MIEEERSHNSESFIVNYKNNRYNEDFGFRSSL